MAAAATTAERWGKAQLWEPPRPALDSECTCEEAATGTRPRVASTLRVLALVTDAFGGTGGIAQYNRDLLGAIANHPATKEVTVVPRTIAREFEPMHPRINHLADVTNSKSTYVTAVVRLAVRRPPFDWIVCGHVNLLPVAYAAGIASGAPLILLTYGIEVWEPRGWLTPQLLSRVRALTSISHFTHHKMSAWAPPLTAPFFLLPNAIDLSAYSPGEAKAALKAKIGISGGPVILTLGRMEAAERSKGFDEILEALPQLLTEFPDLVYIAAGEGTDKRRLQGKASSLGLDRHVVFPGYVPEREKLDYYRLANTFVMPSRGEGFGYVFLEALATGVPVVASKVDGSREAVRDGRWGTLVNPYDRDEIVAAIRSTLLEPHVPPRSELEYFSLGRFENRCHAMLDAIGFVA